MERRSFIRGASLAGAAAGAALLAACGKKEEAASTAAPAVATGGESIRWRLASSFPKSLDTIHGAADTLAQAVSEMTGGRFQITVAAPGEIVPAFGVDDAVSNGTVEMCHTAPYYFVGKDETFAFGTAVPFGLNMRQNQAWKLDGNGMKLMNEFYAERNFVGLIGGDTGSQMGGFWRQEIRSLADLRGKKFRVGGFGGRVMERIGVVPQMIPGGEIYQALERGTIDAAEWVGPYDDEKLGLQRVAQFYAYPGFWEGGAQLEFWIHKPAYDRLSAEYKAILTSAASHAHTVMCARYDYRNPEAIKKLVAGGTRLFRFPRDVMDGAFKAATDLYAEISEKNAAFKKVHDDYMAFRRDSNLWFRFSEASYDTFMQAQRL
jgi:TRAP-type mannitol/chloroaromatic compound transport system substrate-binding protein